MSDSELCTTSQWIKFFCKAGLPPSVAANYAIIFSDNRIQQNMLMDLSKEYLYDMGIKVMGDVIAILKYSKEFHNQIVKEKIIGNNEITTSPFSKRSPATRMLSHYTKPATTPKTQSGGNTLQKVKPSPVRKRISLPPTFEEKPVKKVRRVLPEEEGGYTIKMPTGTTERTRKIMEQQQQIVPNSKKSVFDRLGGECHVSSSTDVKRNISSGSVFKRLGPSSGEVSTSTSIPNREAPLMYRGVLKNTKPETKVITTVKQAPISRITGLSRTVPLSKRLGSKPTTQSKRTVIGHNMQNTGVKQINSILQKTASSFTAGRGVISVRKGPVTASSLTRLGLKSRAATALRSQSSIQGPLILKRTVNTQAVAGKGSVFKRLG